MKIDLSFLEVSINTMARDALNESGLKAHNDALKHIKKTYNTSVDSSKINIKPATIEKLTFSISIEKGSVSLVKKVVSSSSSGVFVMVKRGAPKFIRFSFAASWQKGSSKKWLFLKDTSKPKVARMSKSGRIYLATARRALYTIGLRGMYKSRATLKILTDSFYKHIQSFNK